MDQSPAPVSTNSKTKVFYWLFALTLAAVLLYYSLRGINWRQVWETFKTTQPGYLALMVIASTGSLMLRALRWRVLLQSGGPVKVGTAFWATCAGYFGNNYLPARAGEVIRSMMVDAETGLGRTFVLTTALAERTVDAITLVFISSVVLLTLPTGQDGTAQRRAHRHRGNDRGFGDRGSTAIGTLLEESAGPVANSGPLPEGVGPHSGTDPVRFTSLSRQAASRGIPGVDGGDLVTGRGQFHDGRTVGSLFLTFPMACLLITGLGLGSALPSTPGYVGIYQFVAVEVLTPFGFSRATVIAFMVLVQVLQYVTTGLWGLVALWRFRKLKLEPVQ